MITTHVRVVDRRADRRINGGPGKTHTLCYGAMSVYDVAYSDAKRMTAADREKWISCGPCREMVGKAAR